MKRILPITFLLSLCMLTAMGQDAFITSWVTTDGTVDIVDRGAGFYNVTYYPESNPGAATTLSNERFTTEISGLTNGVTYKVEISGAFSGIYNGSPSLPAGHKAKLRAIDQWGSISWTTMAEAFNGCTNMVVTATDAPNLSSVTSMQNMFRETGLTTEDFNHWDVGNVVNMSGTFAYCPTFNGGVSDWNVSSVTNMSNMFRALEFYETPFAGDLSDWDVGQVTNMASMLDYTAISQENMDAMLLAWSQLPAVQSGVPLGVQGLFYCDATGRDALVNDGWTITGLTNKCPQVLSFDPFPEVTYGSESEILLVFDNSSDRPPTTVTSSNTSVAIIDEYPQYTYTVVIVGPGTTTISAQSAESMNYFESNVATQELVVTSGPAFTTKWNIVNDGSSDWNKLQMVSGLSSSGYTVDWGDGDTYSGTYAPTHTYAEEGEYTVSVTGDFPYPTVRMADRAKLLEISGWGDIVWENFWGSFQYCTNVTLTATDAPDLSGVYTLQEMFSGASSFDGDLSEWDVSGITNMNGMLDGTALSIENYDNLLSGWAEQELQSNVSFGASGVKYCQGETARTSIINNFSWTFYDAGEGCPKLAQTITFDPFEERTFEGSTIVVLPEFASSGLAISYSSSNTAIARILEGHNLQIRGAGTVMITASQAGDDDYDPATPVERTLVIHKGSQTISFDALASRQFGDDSFDLEASSSSGLSVSYTSSDNSVATISGETVTIVGAGTTTITASQNGDEDYNAATPVQQVLTVSKADQSISFAALESKETDDAEFDLTATASSNLEVTYESSNTAVATVSGATVTIVGAGSTTITASQIGDDDYNAATPVQQTLTVTESEIPKLGQTITFEALADKEVGDPTFELTATSTSELEVSYASSNTSVATVSGSTVTIVGAGSTTITASQEGDEMYHPATPVEQTLTVTDPSVKQTQSISFEELDAVTYGDPSFELEATASSGLPVKYTFSNPNVIRGSGNIVTIHGAGTATITAHQDGDETYEAAESVVRTIVVNKAPQTVTVMPIGTKTTTDESFQVVATTTSNITVVCEVVSGPATASGRTITLTGEVGEVVLDVTQPGNSDYLPATTRVSFSVIESTKASQSITFSTLAEKAYGDEPFDLVATASSGLTVSFVSSDETVVTISGSTATIVGAGTAMITASQGGDDSFEAATPVQQSLLVEKGVQSISITAIDDKYTDAEPFEIEYTTSTDSELTFEVSGPATLDGTTVTLTGETGAVTITANLASTSNYIEASTMITFEVLEAGVVLASVRDKEVQVYPNPASSTMIVTSVSDQPLQVFDLMGNLKLRGVTNQALNVSGLDSGVYLIMVSNEKKAKRLIKR